MMRELNMCMADSIPSFPIDPFKMMRDFGLVYQFMNLKKLEGIYLISENKNDIAVAGINYNRPITRRRFTAAHELCHHLSQIKKKELGIDMEDINLVRQSIDSYEFFL
ncbi:protein of unknown function [Megasphaera paucivorans]|uniref:IrrE N-terminal-like domain-containing protein n=2 Tax=Megasphaera paucivorans TaxID=349095 RepID=A0A1H0ACZ1_9FIRM|nr:protein of unknown function [Megasphaera paucivorans]